MLRDVARVVHIVERTAPPGRSVGRELRQPPLIPELHGEPDHVLAVALQHPRDHGAIHSARHRDGDCRFRHTRAPAFADARRTRRPRRSAHPPVPRRSTAPAKSACSTWPAPSSVRWRSVRATAPIAPLEHADPLETANPRRSSAINSGSAVDSIETEYSSCWAFAARQRRSHANPARARESTCSRRSRSHRSAANSLCVPSTIQCAAAPAPPRPRRSRYPRAGRAHVGPPNIIAPRLTPLRTYSAPIPFGA